MKEALDNEQPLGCPSLGGRIKLIAASSLLSSFVPLTPVSCSDNNLICITTLANEGYIQIKMIVDEM